MNVEIEDAFDLGEAECNKDAGEFILDYLGYREPLPRWMVEKYACWDEADRIRRMGHTLPELPEVGGVK